MPAALETIQAVAEAIEARRMKAIEAFDRAALQLEDIRARLRYAIGDTEAVENLIAAFGPTAVEGGVAFQDMMRLALDLRGMIQPERERLVEPIDVSTRMDVLTERMACTAQGASFDLDALADMLRGGPESGSSEDVVKLAGTIQASHQKLQDDLSEALQVGSCWGSA